MKLSLSGKVAVVTGASSGVGRAIALGLAAQQMKVCLVGRRLDALKAVADTAQAHGQQVEICPADLTVDSELVGLEKRIRERCGRVDVLVHSAGVFGRGTFESASSQSFDDQYHCNVRAPFLLTQALLPSLREARGQIVFINSTAGLQARAQVGQYSATKHALKALSDSLREEVNPAGIRVLNLFLGRTATPMQESIFREEGRVYHGEKLLQPEDVAELLVVALQLPQTAELTELHLRPSIKSY